MPLLPRFRTGKSRRRPRPACRHLEVECLEERTLLSAAPVTPFTPGETVHGRISTAGEVDRYTFTVGQDDTKRIEQALYLRTHVHADGFRSRLSLDGPDGGLLVQSDGKSLTDPDDEIVQYLTAGAYTL